MLGFLLASLSILTFASDVHHEVIPSAFNKNNKVEFFWKAPEGKGPFPVYIIVHGHQGTYRKGGALIAQGNALDIIAKSGMIGVAVSQAGYGLTSGKSDHAGIESQNALISVIRFFQKSVIAEPRRIILYGTSMGATLAAITATREQGIAGIILENGMYDVRAGLNQLSVQAHHNTSFDVLLNLLIEETGSGFLERSALFQTDKIKSRVLIFAGLGDRVALPDQSLRFHEALRSSGVESEFYLFPFAGHNIPLQLKVPAMKSFIENLIRL